MISKSTRRSVASADTTIGDASPNESKSSSPATPRRHFGTLSLEASTIGSAPVDTTAQRVVPTGTTSTETDETPPRVHRTRRTAAGRRRQKARSGVVGRIVGSFVSAVVLVAMSSALASPAHASVSLGNDGSWGSTTVHCYHDLNRAFIDVDLRANSFDGLGATVSTDKWDGYRWVRLAGTTWFDGMGTVDKAWWTPVLPDGYYRHTVTYKRYDARYGTTWNSSEILGQGTAWDSYRQMHRTSTGGYIAGSASYCTL